MKILVTGAKGFIGRNVIAELGNRGGYEVLACDVDTQEAQLEIFAAECEFVCHFAGVNRPKEEKEFMEGNFGFTDTLLKKLKSHGNRAPILITSSIQAELDNPYGRSKKAGEELLFSYGEETGARVLIYRLPNVFGKWCRPNYNSAIATFCHNIARSLPIVVNDPSVMMHVVYIDDLVEECLRAMEGSEYRQGRFCEVPVTYHRTLGEIADTIRSFADSRVSLEVPDMGDELVKKLYAAYLSYLPKDAFSYPLNMKVDERGSFTEFLRTKDRGQVSVNVAKPGIVKGNHWHHTKNEKFLVVKGEAVIRFRKIEEEEIIEYRVSGEKLQVVDIPTGYTHCIENVGEGELVTVMWASEAFDEARPDTYFMPVK